MSRQDHQVLQQAQAQGLLPATATWPAQDAAPWPLTVLTALGAWFASVPLLAGLAMMLGPLWRTGGFLLIGLGLVVTAVAVLRRAHLALFIEQVMLPVLLAGLVGVAFGVGGWLQGDEGWRLAVAAAGVTALLAAMGVPQGWLRSVLGAGVLAAWAVYASPHWWGQGEACGAFLWAVLYPSLAVWLALLLAQRVGVQRGPARHMRALRAAEQIGRGWIALWLMLAIAWAGPTFLIGGGGGWVPSWHLPAQAGALRGGSVLLAAAASAWLWRIWPACRQLRWLLPALCLLALAWAVPLLGAVLMVGAVALGSGRRAVAILALLAALWLLGSFYYSLAWPLAYKGVALMGGGLLVALSMWRPRSRVAAADASPATHRGAMVALLGVLAVTLALANTTIWRHEQVLAHGETVYVALAPVDPRSLMQGDYMQLAFALPDLPSPLPARVRLQRDARGVATVLGADDASRPLGDNELTLPLRRGPTGGVLVSDAWYFPEGQAERYATARYGLFRVLPNGRALLAGLADEHLQPL